MRKVVCRFDTALRVLESDLKRIQLALVSAGPEIGFVTGVISGRRLGMLSTH
jgi:hypothetical protein